LAWTINGFEKWRQRVFTPKWRRSGSTRKALRGTG
jgi:hypothetical protein